MEPMRKKITYLKSQVAQNNRLRYPKVPHNWLKVAPKYRLLAYQVYYFGGFRNPAPRGR